MAYSTWVGTSHRFVSKLVPKLRPPTHNRGRGGVAAPGRDVLRLYAAMVPTGH